MTPLEALLAAMRQANPAQDPVLATLDHAVAVHPADHGVR